MTRMIGLISTSRGMLWMGVFAVGLWLAVPLPGRSQAGLPEGAGKELTATVCTQCHGLDNIMNVRLSREDWASLVNDMISRGAPAFDNQHEVIIDYLATNFGPGSRASSSTALAGAGNPAPSQRAVAEGAGKELVESNCAGCHALSFVTDSRYTAEEWKNLVNDMIARGAVLLDDEIAVVVQYLAENYGPGNGGAAMAGAAAPRGRQGAEESAGGPAGLPDGPGKDLVATVCTQCHGLNNIVTLRLSAPEWESLVNDMISRGAPAFDDQYKTIAQYLSTNFGNGK